MAGWGFEGAYLHGELGEQTCLTEAETEPISWKCQGGWSLLFALYPTLWTLWRGWDHGTGPVPLADTLQPQAILSLQL